MSSRATTIELNGKRYDMRSGVLIDDIKAAAPAIAKPTTKPAKVMDGVSRLPRTHSPVHHSRQADKSKTLMRAGLKKPALVAATPKTPVIAKHTTPRYVVNPHREQRAKTVNKSTLVSRFGAASVGVKAQTSVLPVQPEPTPAPPLQLFDGHKKTKINTKVAASTAHKSLFQHAVENASSHSQPKAHPTKRSHRVAKKMRVSPKALNFAAGSMAAVLLIGFIAFQNVPNLSMRVATARAGVDGRIPSYQPAGFSLSGPIQYQPGQITLAYQSNSDSRNFVVNQRSSQWSSDSLLEQYVAPNKQDYQTFEENGKTVYVYDKTNATWVDGGVWYQIEGDSALSNDQLLQMAASM